MHYALSVYDKHTVKHGNDTELCHGYVIFHKLTTIINPSMKGTC